MLVRIFIHLSLVLAWSLLVTSCGSCKNETIRSYGINRGAISPSPTPDEAGVIQDDIDHEILNDVGTLETTKNLLSTTLLFTAQNDQVIDGRYLSEFLLVVRASEKSCFRVKFRPSAAFDSGASGDNFDKSDEPICDFTPDAEDPQATPSPSPNPSISPDPTVTAAGAKFALSYEKDLTPYASEEDQSFALASQDLCSRKVFKMSGASSGSLAEPAGLEASVAKTGWLIAISPGNTIGVWVDDEFGYPCLSGSTPSDLDRVHFELDRSSNNYFDRFTLSHAKNIAEEMEGIVSRLTAAYGATSDVDKNGRINIFISPEVNRSHFKQFYTTGLDHIQADFFYKPEDLAKYDPTTNPRSNEGETLYLWAPDPIGIFKYSQFPSSNSLTSNYAKGYLASQVMTLIITNAHLIQRQAQKPEERWLVETLAMLGAANAAGNDWPFFSLASYLSSRPQQLSLTHESIADSDFTKNEELGLRAVFAWYLHARMCDATSVSPCAALKALIDTDEVGVANIEKVLASKMDAVLENFGISVAVELTDKPSAIRDAWKDSYPPKAVAMPGLLEVTPTPKTVENNAGSTALVSPPEDRTWAGPFPSRDMITFQALLPDNDLDFRLAKNAVTFIHVKGLVEKVSEAVATLGPNLKVIFIPIGDRDVTRHAIHVEKISEHAPMDQRSTNLLKDKDSGKTYFSEPYYGAASADANYTVTADRDLQIFGSIDNFKVNRDGAGQDVGDSDSYSVMISPCRGLSDPDLSLCKAKNHRVIVQTIVQDFPKKLMPMAMVTSTDLGLFRGMAAFAQAKDISPNFSEAPDDGKSTPISFLCEADAMKDATWSTVSNVVTVTTKSPHGLVAQNSIIITPSASNSAYFGTKTVTAVPTPTTFTFAETSANSTGTMNLSAGLCANGGRTVNDPTYLNPARTCARNAAGVCPDGRLPQAGFYDHYSGLQVTYDNFLHSGSLLTGSPFFNYGLIYWTDMPPRIGPRAFNQEEINRQFFSFDFDKDLKPRSMNLWAVDKAQATYVINNVRSNPLFTSASDNQITALLEIKGALLLTPPPDTAEFEGPCSALDIPVSFCHFNDGNVLNAATKAQLAAQWLAFANAHFLLCLDAGQSCERVAYLAALPAPQAPHYIHATAAVKNWLSYYTVSEPAQRDDVCSGNPLPAGLSFQPNACFIKAESLTNTKDIRTHLNAAKTRVYEGGCDQLLYSDFDICFDSTSFLESIDPEKQPISLFQREGIPTERKHPHNLKAQPAIPELLPTFIATSRGEVISKTGRLYSLSFYVPGTNDSPIHILLGGRASSQGKYTLRVRLKDGFDQRFYDP